MFKRFRDEKGFTLIELLVVILIIGILLAIAAPSFLGQQDKAKASEAKQALSVVYKDAKAEATSNEANPGAFPSPAELAPVISENEPQYTVKTAADSSEVGNGEVGIVAASGSNLTLMAKDDGGKLHTLTVTNGAAPQITSED